MSGTDKPTIKEYAAELAQSQEVAGAAHELYRLWRQGWDRPGSSGYQSFIMAHRALADMLPDYRGNLAHLARDVWTAYLALPRT